MRSLQHAVTQSHGAIFMTDGAGIVSRLNPTFEKLTGYSSLQIIGKDLSFRHLVRATPRYPLDR